MLILTCRGAKTPCAGGPLCFTKFGVWSFVLASLLLALTACPLISRVTDFTWYGNGQNLLRLYGFFGMTMFAAIYYILPRVVGLESFSPGRVRVHFWLGVVGTMLFALPLVAGGVMQGLKLVNPVIPFVDVAKAALMPFRLSTLGETLLLVGNFVFLFNVFGVIVSHLRTVGKTVYTDATAELEPAGVKP
jgi:cbb3-type cytochrome oxidase subunit 1